MQKGPVAVAHFHDGRRLRQHLPNPTLNALDELGPDLAFVEHQVGLFRVWHVVVAKGRVVDMPAVDAAHKIQRIHR